MNNDDLSTLFNKTPVPQPDYRARQRIKQEALAVFRHANAETAKINANASQGTGHPARLTDTTHAIRTKTRQAPMTQQQRFKSRHWAGGLAASAALIVGLFTIEHYRFDNPNSSADNTAQQRVSQHQQAPAQIGADTTVADMAPRPVTAPTNAKTIKPKPQRSPESALMATRMNMRLPPTATAPPHLTERDRFASWTENPIKLTTEAPVSTFSIDVDTASYSFVRRQLNHGRLPATDAVRTEEMINYFNYGYAPPPQGSQPFATHVNVVDSPWTAGNKLIHIGIKGVEIDAAEQPDSNLVLLLDVSGSMNQPDKLPLVKQAMGLLLQSLKPSDSIAIVTYAGAASTVLEPTPVAEKEKILVALEQIQAGGATAGGQGLALAYRLAELNYNKTAINRVILATDGDFNVGITEDERLEDFVARKRQSGIYLSVIGFGQGNYQDARMQTLAHNGNGIAAYIDTLGEAQKVLLQESTRSLFPIANDVKVQVEFNPNTVAEYRLLGYESRMLERGAFHNDKVDAGDIGSGHRVTAIYEITPAGSTSGLISSSRYQAVTEQNQAEEELAYLQIRYKQPGHLESQLISTAIIAAHTPSREPQQDRTIMEDINFSIAVAAFAQLLRGGTYTANWTYDDVIQLAQSAKGNDNYGYRAEFIQLVRKAKIAKAM